MLPPVQKSSNGSTNLYVVKDGYNEFTNWEQTDFFHVVGEGSHLNHQMENVLQVYKQKLFCTAISYDLHSCKTYSRKKKDSESAQNQGQMTLNVLKTCLVFHQSTQFSLQGKSNSKLSFPHLVSKSGIYYEDITNMRRFIKGYYIFVVYKVI